jgi:hypothetical protein
VQTDAEFWADENNLRSHLKYCFHVMDKNIAVLESINFQGDVDRTPYPVTAQLCAMNLFWSVKQATEIMRELGYKV